MKKNDIETIKKELAFLIGQHLRSIIRLESDIATEFGELIEMDTIYHNENGKIAYDADGKALMKEQKAGRYSLQASCNIRLTRGNEIIVGKGDRFTPKAELENKFDFDWHTFDWDVLGNNHFDEMVAKYIGDEPSDFVVKKITVSKYGDLKITFTNGFALEFFVDVLEGLNWALFDHTIPKYYFAVTGNEIKRSDSSDSKE